MATIGPAEEKGESQKVRRGGYRLCFSLCLFPLSTFFFPLSRRFWGLGDRGALQ